ncbi:hypothetical protein J6590_008943 [Homalodisca vitripennis]|nr:hypothetical protein J6590_008943 [Homalodisca vitripennis]
MTTYQKKAFPILGHVCQYKQQSRGGVLESDTITPCPVNTWSAPSGPPHHPAQIEDICSQRVAAMWQRPDAPSPSAGISFALSVSPLELPAVTPDVPPGMGPQLPELAHFTFIRLGTEGFHLPYMKTCSAWIYNIVAKSLMNKGYPATLPLGPLFTYSPRGKDLSCLTCQGIFEC